MKKSVLVAPLNWGLGHATRCIPIINALIERGFQPQLASDGMALELLRKEFPELPFHELPSYQISYSKKKKGFKYKLLFNSPKIIKAIKEEQKFIKELLETSDLAGIISDNRLGIYHDKVPSVFISHQIKVLSGSTTWLSTKLHQKYINKFDECWVPDYEIEPSLSGILGHAKLKIPIKYLGAVSRMEKKELPKSYDLVALLSGPEPQRQMLEDQLIKQLQSYEGTTLLIRGVVEDQQSRESLGDISVVNFMTAAELEEVLNASDLVLSRSGYTTILDLNKLGKKAFFIPTPGQFEQEYLAERLDKMGLAPYCEQEEFTISQLERVKNYKGLKMDNSSGSLFECFSLFEGE